jgi:hypothetical protein
MHLEASMLGYEPTQFGDAIRDHQAAARERRAAEAQALGLDWTADEVVVEEREAELV